GVDFDLIVLGISIGALPFVASELIAASPRWQRMVERVKTVRTTALQMWVTAPIEELASSADAPIVGAYQMPLETWADMTHLVSVEGWGARDGVRGLLYACGQLGSGNDPIPAQDPEAADLAMFEQVAQGFFTQDLAHVWPSGADPSTGGLRWDLLFDP